MATIKAPTMHDRVYAGAAGNLSLEFGKVKLANAAVDDVVELLDMPIGMKLVGVRVVSDGLGASVTVDIKIGTTVLKAGQDVANATQALIPFEPVYLKERSTLTATIKGGAATGSLTVMPEYVSVGY